MTRPPDDYIDLILIPNILHTPAATFWEMPWVLQEKTRRLLQPFIAAGWAGNLATIRRENAE